VTAIDGFDPRALYLEWRSPLGFIEKTDHPLKDVIIELRKIILASDSEITEHIKWNAPSFCVNGEDRFTFKLNAPDAVDIVFHRGVKAKALPSERLIEDPARLLKWATNDRALATFTNMTDIQNKESALLAILNEWKKASIEMENGQEI
jgi:hypothetical protein